jgi:hypothetical protein
MIAMKCVKACSLFLLTAVTTFSGFGTYAVAYEKVPQSYEKADLSSSKGIFQQVGRLIFDDGNWIIKTAAGAVVGRSVGAVTDYAIDYSRQQYLANRIHDEQADYYSVYGTPIPVTSDNVLHMMSRIGAVQSDQDFVVTSMHAYWY